ncbi:MAG: hypothetical protein ABTD50_24500 [Polyangiaceae bacterium]
MGGFVLGSNGKRGVGILGAVRGMFGELGGVLAKERIVVSERHDDAPERVVVLEAQSVANPE